jgi:sulfate adenylyltransferase
MRDLIPPHGELTEPVSCTVPETEQAGFAAKAASLPKVVVSDADLSTVYRFGDGGLSPLTGPMDRATYDRVLDEEHVVHAGKKYAWTIPLSLPVTADQAGKLGKGQTVALVNSAGAVVATLEISDVFPWDKPRYLKSVYGTERTDHPGADMVLKNDADKTHLVGGTIRVLPQPKHPRFGKFVLSPREVRAVFRQKGWERVVAFQTRNPLHRAHEYALVYGLETLIRQGLNAGAVLNPLIGETKGDDVDADTRMKRTKRSSTRARSARATTTRRSGSRAGKRYRTACCSSGSTSRCSTAARRRR